MIRYFRFKARMNYFKIFFFLFIVQITYAQIPGRMGTGGSTPSRLGQQGDGGKIIDDSTKNIYGPKTTHYFLEKDVFENRKTLYEIDTNYSQFHEYSFIQKTKNQYVDLGNLGTAARSVFFRPVEQIGTMMGYDAYSLYAAAIDEVRFYNTRSPYTNMYVVLGGNGQNILRFDHSQNIKPNFNLGLSLQRATSEKQYGSLSTTNSQNNLAQNWTFVMNANYESKDGKYTFLGQFNHLNHSVLEQGGTIPDSTAFKAGTGDVQYFNTTVGLPIVLSNNASSWERRNRWHLYHQYKMAQGFQLYHVLDYYGNKNIFIDRGIATGVKNGLYKETFFPTTFTNQDVRYALFENKFGIKGHYKDFNYRMHYRNRLFSQNTSLNKTDSVYVGYKTTKIENFVGLWMDYYLKDSTQRITAEFEYFLGKDFKIRGDITTKWFDAGYSTIRSSPTLLQQNFASNHLTWSNNFNILNSNNVYGQVNLRTKYFRFSPRLDYHLINNYIYFNESAKPEQYTTALNVFRLGADFNFQKKRWLINGQTYFSLVENDKILRIPKFFANLRVAFDFVFVKVLYVQIGTDLHYKSRYYADAYMPVTQQFYIQNKVQAEGYPLVDAFANFRINRVKLFVKFSNAPYRAFGLDGYYSTPFYPAMGRTFGFGVNWPLFD